MEPSGPGAYTVKWIVSNRAGEGKDREHGSKTINKFTLIQSLWIGVCGC